MERAWEERRSRGEAGWPWMEGREETRTDKDEVEFSLAIRRPGNSDSPARKPLKDLINADVTSYDHPTKL